MNIRKDFQSATLYLERLLLYSDEFAKNNLEHWPHLKNNEDFRKVYEMDENTRPIFEVIYSYGRDLAVDMSFKLEEFNNVSEYPTITSYLASFYDTNGNFWNLKELEKISLQAQQKRDEMNYGCPWAVEQMILLFDKQVELLKHVSDTLNIIKTTDIYEIENSRSIIKKQTTPMTEIKLGDGTIIYGDLVLANSIKDSFNKVTSAEISDELRELIIALSKEVAKIIQSLPQETAQQVTRDLETLTAEATSKTPRSQWLQLSVDGLKQAATNIGAIGKPVLELVAKILPLLIRP